MYNTNLTKANFHAVQDIPIQNISIGELLAKTAHANKYQEALVEITLSGTVGRRWSYQALYEDSLRLAYALASRFEKGSKIVIWSPNSPEWVLVEYATSLAGIILVTANPSLQEKELRYILEKSSAVALFLVTEFRGNPMLKIGIQATKGNSSIREIIEITDHNRLFRNDQVNKTLPIVLPEDPAQIQYTSGTTGFPKGAMLSHLGLLNNANFYASRCKVTNKHTWINIMPMFHTSGCGMVTLGCLNSGCRMVLISLFCQKNVVDLIAQFSADLLLGVPTTVLALLEEQELKPRDVSSLKVISCGGANVAPEMVKRVQKTFGCAFSTLYGQTEHSPVITQHFLTDSLEDLCGTIGQPLSQTEVSIQSTDDHKILPLGEVGEICARGPSVMLEYYGDLKATTDTIDEAGWLHTGDLGKMDARGYVTISGRLKEMIIRGGENYFPAEIENILREHEAISDIAVVGIPNKKWGEIIAAFIRFRREPLSAKHLKTFCRHKMSPQKTPNIWVAVEYFPLTGSGKIKKFKLGAQFQAGKYREIS